MAMTQAVFSGVRIGQHPCTDRLVLVVDGTSAVGWTVQYVPLVHADPSDKPVPVAGLAALRVVLRAPAGLPGHPVVAPPATYVYVSPAQVATWASLREVRLAGNFEGVTTLAVGVSHTQPFHVTSYLSGGQRLVVIDLLH